MPKENSHPENIYWEYFEQYDGFTEKILTMKQFNADQQTNYQNI